MTKRLKIILAAGMMAAMATAGTALAQRDPAYQAARSQGLVGEQEDGYLGIVGTASADVRALVQDINIKRKAAYTRLATQQGATVEQVAFVSGCNLIAQTAPGEKYRAPDGSWQTRGAGAPVRDARCV
ncbi:MULTISPECIES: YdbL family protein [unclassified Sphingomonas]|jgi:uncharacterized protein YdbL (DUF1318 family)|uniref:YdbL family protein n=1 Tax=unclassified Sphingomonas TaxID=196159 RepID=UPI0008315C3F|nr:MULTISPECIES: YdbL family protein [unclassified Sphingomonas]